MPFGIFSAYSHPMRLLVPIIYFPFYMWYS